jgi:hypothetical protein
MDAAITAATATEAATTPAFGFSITPALSATATAPALIIRALGPWVSNHLIFQGFYPILKLSNVNRG